MRVHAEHCSLVALLQSLRTDGDDDGVSDSNADFVSVADNGREEGGHEREREREREASSELLLIDQGRSMSA